MHGIQPAWAGTGSEVGSERNLEIRVIALGRTDETSEWCQVTVGTEVMVASEEHLWVGVHRVHANKITGVQVISVRNNISRAGWNDPAEGAGLHAGFVFGWTGHDLGRAQLVGHDHEKPEGTTTRALVCC